MSAKVEQKSEVELLVAQKSEAELEALFEQMQKIVTEKRDTKRTAAILEIEKIAVAAGLTVMIKGHRKTKNNSDEPKLYKNPNGIEQYDGNGRQPKWLRDLLKSGRKLEEFLVPAPAQAQPVNAQAKT